MFPAQILKINQTKYEYSKSTSVPAGKVRRPPRNPEERGPQRWPPFCLDWAHGARWRFVSIKFKPGPSHPRPFPAATPARN